MLRRILSCSIIILLMGSVGYGQDSEKSTESRLEDIWKKNQMLHQESLAEQSLKDLGESVKEAYRLYRESWGQLEMIRLQKEAEGFKVVYKKLNDQKKVEEIERSISAQDWQEFYSYLEKSDFWNLPYQDNVIGLDGADYDLEGLRDNKEHLIHRWTPEDGAIKELFEYMFKMVNKK